MINTILPALELLCVEGMKQDSPLKIKKAVKEIRRDSRRFGWTDDAIETMPNEWQWRICTARLQLGMLDWRGWSWRNPRAGNDPFDFPRWKLGLPVYPALPELREPEKVGRLLVYSEMGIGDQLMFANAFHYLEGYADEIVIEVEPRLAGLFERSFPQYTIQPLKDLRDASWVTEPFDAKVLYGDVCARFLRKKEDFLTEPYIKPDREKVMFWRKWLEDNVPKPWVGFSWAGRQGYIDPEYGKGCINLQYGEWDVPDYLYTPPIDLKEDIEDVFGIVANLDNVICVPNTLSHIAGVMGIPCDTIMTLGKGQVNNAINWRWGMPEDSKTIWHPSITIYRNLKQWLKRPRIQ
jgi:hypothetical protein